MKNNLHNEIRSIDYKNQSKKLHNLFLNNSYHNSVTSKDPDKVIFNFSGHVFNTTEKSIDPLKILLKYKDIIIQKADKSNTVVILNRKDYRLCL